MAPPAGASWGQLTTEGAVGTTVWNCCRKRPELTVRDSPRTGAGPAVYLPQRKGMAKAGTPGTPNGFPYRKDFLDSLCPVFEILGSIQEFLQVCFQKGFILRGQRMHVRGRSWGVSFPAVFQDFFQGHPWTIPSSSPSCPGYAPRGHSAGRPKLLPWCPWLHASCRKGLGRFCALGEKNIFSKETLLKAKGWPREILGASEGNALTELRDPRNQEENHMNCECLKERKYKQPTNSAETQPLV